LDANFFPGRQASYLLKLPASFLHLLQQATMRQFFTTAAFVLVLATSLASGSAQLFADEKLRISGVYPHLAHANLEKEVGIGAVVSWAGSLWTNTYGPHLPHGSTDKLRQIDQEWNMHERPESVGGTPANRMIHTESQQLLMGHHLIDKRGHVRTIDPKQTMPGRITANARHLIQPESKVYYLTMENGVYEVDVNTLAVRDIVRDPLSISRTHLPGYHGKGAYTCSGRVVVSNNGEPGQTSPSGCLATWDGSEWNVVARNQFTEVTGPGGLRGNTAADDRLWATGWDAKSVRLFVLEAGEWTKFRLPKGSYTHDANHGWNTEWPRIRRVRPDLTLMHMHGLFYEFPQTFSKANRGGLRPLATYVKMPVDYAWFNNQLVIGKDDASKFDNDFVKQAQSNLWIGNIEDLQSWGPKSGFGGVWLNNSLDIGTSSEPFFVGGFKHVNLHLHHKGRFACPVEIQVDRQGKGAWQTLATLRVEKQTGYAHAVFSNLDAQWIQLVARGAAHDLTAYFQLSSPHEPRRLSRQFASLASIGQPAPPGATLQLPAGLDMKLNAFTESGLMQIDGELQAAAVEPTAEDAKTRKGIAIAADKRVGFDRASAFVQFVDEAGQTTKLRLPRGDARFDATVNKVRALREIVTERTALNLHGTFYEVPRPRPGSFLNFWQIKPIASHDKHIFDFCSWRGLLVFSGARSSSAAPHHISLGDSGLWLGEVDDLWKLGKPVGEGGPWLDNQVKKGQPSDPYLMLGYQHKTLTLSHQQAEPVRFVVEVDFLGTGDFAQYATLKVKPGELLRHQFQDGYVAHWVRIVPMSNATATAQFSYR